jgi:hypothetical protein
MKGQARKRGGQRKKEEMGHRGNVAKLNAPRRKEVVDKVPRTNRSGQACGVSCWFRYAGQGGVGEIEQQEGQQRIRSPA